MVLVRVGRGWGDQGHVASLDPPLCSGFPLNVVSHKVHSEGRVQDLVGGGGSPSLAEHDFKFQKRMRAKRKKSQFFRALFAFHFMKVLGNASCKSWIRCGDQCS